MEATRGTVNISDIAAGKHPVIFEMGKERKCGPIFPLFLRQNFLEFKFEIPFVTASHSSNQLVYKNNIIMDNYLNVLFTEPLYRLNTSFSKIEMTKDSYSLNLDGKQFEATVTDTGEWGGLDGHPELDVYRRMMNMPWTGDSNIKICAQHNYRFSGIQSRPVAMHLALDWNVLTARKGVDSFSTPSITDSLSAIEVIVDTTISAPLSCDEAFL